MVARADLLDEVWEPDYDGGSNVVDVVMRSLRRKLGDRAFDDRDGARCGLPPAPELSVQLPTKR